MSKASVIIPTHDRADFLRLAIISTLNQTFQDCEIIIVDDGAKDNTQEIVNSFSDKRIKYIRHEANKGPSAARNTGIAASNSDYIAFLDDDDEWLPKKLEKQINLLESSPSIIGGVYTGFLNIDRESGKVFTHQTPTKRGNILNDLLIDNCIGTASTVLLRKECFERVGLFDDNIHFSEDWDMWIRISKEFEFEYVNEPLVRHYIHANRLSSNSNREIQIKGLEMVLKKYGQLFVLNKKDRSKLHLALGVLYCFNGDAKRGRELLLKATTLNPFEIRHYFNLFLSVFGADAFKNLKEIKDTLLFRSKSLDNK